MENKPPQKQKTSATKRKDNIKYEFKTSHGKMWVDPSDIMEALFEMSNCKETETDITPPEEDLQGWGIVFATDELGQQRPLLLMRALPTPSCIRPYSTVKNDDNILREILLKDVYKLTKFKIWWKTFKIKIKNLFKRKKIPLPPKTQSGWLSEMPIKKAGS